MMSPSLLCKLYIYCFFFFFFYSGFSQIGHIVHVNLREELLPYKKVIGQILLDKVKGCKYVLIKCSSACVYDLLLMSRTEMYEALVFFAA